MRKVKFLLGGVALNLLLNATAGLLGRDDAIRLTRWGWLFLLLYATYLLLTEEAVKQAALRLHKKRGGSGVFSYIVVAFLGATLAVIYWAAINGVYSRMFRAQLLPTQPAQPEPTPESHSAMTPTPTTTTQSMPQLQQTEEATSSNAQPVQQSRSKPSRRRATADDLQRRREQALRDLDYKKPR